MNRRVMMLFIMIVCFGTAAWAQSGKSATEWFRDGVEKARNKDFYGAIDDFTRAIELRPAFAKAYYHRGIAYLRYDRKSKTHSIVYKRKARTDLMKARELGFAVEQKYIDECD
jgi:Flp pilus assembly protein TadD